MPGQIFHGRVHVMIPGKDDVPILKGRQMTGKVRVLSDHAGNLDAQGIVDRDQSIVERPVAELAQGKPIGGMVVMGDGPVLDVGRINSRVAVRCDHADTAQGAAVGIDPNNGTPESLIPDRTGRRIVFRTILPGVLGDQENPGILE